MFGSRDHGETLAVRMEAVFGFCWRTVAAGFEQREERFQIGGRRARCVATLSAIHNAMNTVGMSPSVPISRTNIRSSNPCGIARHCYEKNSKCGANASGVKGHRYSDDDIDCKRTRNRSPVEILDRPPEKAIAHATCHGSE